MIVAGMDEVGRGALAGPVVACACVLLLPLTRLRCSPPRWRPHKVRGSDVRIADSKLLSPVARQCAHEWLLSRSQFGIGMADVAEINDVGIVRATHRAMTRALDALLIAAKPDLILIDGRDGFAFPIPCRSIIRGDQTEASIAAASVIAKVTRDRMLCEAEKQYRNFSFGTHKGYGTAKHLRELKVYGPTAFHRSLFIRSALASSADAETSREQLQRQQSAL